MSSATTPTVTSVAETDAATHAENSRRVHSDMVGRLLLGGLLDRRPLRRTGRRLLRRGAGRPGRSGTAAHGAHVPVRPILSHRLAQGSGINPLLDQFANHRDKP